MKLIYQTLGFNILKFIMFIQVSHVLFYSECHRLSTRQQNVEYQSHLCTACISSNSLSFNCIAATSYWPPFCYTLEVV